MKQYTTALWKALKSFFLNLISFLFLVTSLHNCLQAQVTFTTTNSVSDAFINLQWIIPVSCYQSAGGSDIYVQLWNADQGQEIYFEIISDTSQFSNNEHHGSFQDLVGPGMLVNYQLNLFIIGPGLPVCNSVSSSGTTLPFQSPSINVSQNIPHKISIDIDNNSDLLSYYNIYRNGVLMGSLAASDTIFDDVIDLSDNNSIINGGIYNYCVNVYNAEFMLEYSAVCADGKTKDLNVRASDDAYPDKVEIIWSSNEDYTDLVRITRDGNILSNLGSGDSIFYDNDPVYGKKHLYGIHIFYNGKETVAEYDTGSVEANGSISGHVFTIEGNYSVPGLLISAQATIGGKTFTYSDITDASGSYSINKIYYDVVADYSVSAVHPTKSFTVNPITVHLTKVAAVKSNVNFFDSTVYSIDTSNSISLSNFSLTPVKNRDLLEVDVTYNSGGLLTWFQLYRDDEFISIINDQTDSLPMTDRSGIPGQLHTYKLIAYVMLNNMIVESSIEDTVTFPSVAEIPSDSIDVIPDTVKGTVLIEWSHTSDNYSGVIVYRNGELEAYVEKGNNTYEDLKGIPDTITVYSLVAVRNVGGTNYYSGATVAPAVNFPALAVPQMISAIPSALPHLINVNWTYSKPLSYNYDGFLLERIGQPDSSWLIVKGTAMEYADRSVLPDSQYYYQVSAYRTLRSGRLVYSPSSLPSVWVPAPLVPVPTSLSATDSLYEDKVIVSWSYGGNYTLTGTGISFIILRDADTVGIVPFPATSFIDYINLPVPGPNQYSYTVRAALKKVKRSFYSAAAMDIGSRKAFTGGPTLPVTNLQASTGFVDHVRLSWDYPNYITLAEFQIYREGVLIATLPYDSRTYYDAGVAAGIFSSYQVRVFLPGYGYSPYRSAMGKRQSVKGIKGIVSTVNGKIGVQGVTVTASLTKDSILVFERSTTSDLNGLYSLPNLAMNTGDVVIVKAELAGHQFVQASKSITVNATKDMYTVHFDDLTEYILPSGDSVADPIGVSIIPDLANGTVEISWSVSNSNYSGFYITRGIGVIASIPGTEARYHVDTSGYPETDYMYQVTTYWVAADSTITYSQPSGYTVTYPGLQALGSFTVTPVLSGNHVRINWSHSAGNIDGYKIFRQDDLLADVSANEPPQVLDTTGFPGQIHEYSIVSYKNTSFGTVESDPVAQMVVFPLVATPKNLVSTINASNNSVTISWNLHAKYFEGFRLSRNGTFLKEIARNASGTYQFVDYGMIPEFQANYTLKAFLYRNDVPYESSVVSVQTTFPPVYPLDNLSAQKVDSLGVVRLSWAYPDTNGIHGFRIYRFADSNYVIFDLELESGYYASAGASATSYTDMSGIPGKRYWYTVTPYVTVNNLSKYPDQFCCVSGTPPYYSGTAFAKFPDLPVPSNLSASDGSFQSYIKLSWEYPINSIDSFQVFRKLSTSSLFEYIASVGGGKRSYIDLFIEPVAGFNEIFEYKIRARKTVDNTTVHSAYSNIDSGSVSPYSVTNPIASGEITTSSPTYLKGQPFAVDDNWLVVGERNHQPPRIVIYKKSNTGSWTQHQTIQATQVGGFGTSVDIDMEYGLIVVGDPAYSSSNYTGSIFIYQLMNNNWTEIYSFKASSTYPVFYLGESVSVSGPTVAYTFYLDVPSNNFQLNTYNILTHTTQIHRPYGITSTAQSGNVDVDIDSDNLILSSIETQKLYFYIDPDSNSNLDRTISTYLGKNSVAISDCTAVVGGSNSLLEIYQRNDTDWVNTGIGQQPDPTGANRSYVDIRNNFAAVGYFSASDTGMVNLYKKNKGEWKLFQTFRHTQPVFGGEVHLSGNHIFIGAEDDNGNGVIHIYPLSNHPYNVEASKGIGPNVIINWDYDFDADDYVIYRDGILLSSASVNFQSKQATDQNVVPAKKYVYEVAAVKNGIESWRSGDIGWSAADGVIRGSVVTATDGQGVSNVKIVAEGLVEGEWYTYMDSTDLNGEYSINGVYYGNVEGTYHITASFKDHDITPALITRTLKPGLGLNTVNAQFIDNTAYIIKGHVVQLGSSCGMDGIKLELETIRNNFNDTLRKDVKTDADGFYSFVVDPLALGLNEINLSVANKQLTGELPAQDTILHAFSPGRVSYTDFSNFPRTQTQNFTDTLTYPVEIIVQTVCGPITGSEFTVNVRSKDGCFNQTFTVPVTGKLKVNLPPRSYIIVVDDVLNPTPALVPIRDYLKVRPFNLDLFGLHQEYAFILTNAQIAKRAVTRLTYHKTPVVSIITVLDRLCDDATKPVLLKQGDLWGLTFSVTENHVNGGSCFVNEGYLKIINKASNDSKPVILDYDTNNNSFPVYTFEVGDPNLIVPYLKSLTIQYFSEIDEFLGQLVVPVIVEGSKSPPGNDVIVELGEGTAKIPLYILRDPDGDGSFSEINTGTTINKTLSITSDVTLSGGAAVSGNVISATGGVFFDVSLSGGKNFHKGKEWDLTLTTNTDIQTSSDPSFTGEKADIIMGSGVAMQYGIIQTLKIDDTCGVVKSTTLGFSPNNITTSWVYSVSFIETLIGQYEQDVQRIRAGTLTLQNPDGSVRDKGSSIRYLETLVSNWQNILEYHRIKSLPHYILCDKTENGNYDIEFLNKVFRSEQAKSGDFSGSEAAALIQGYLNQATVALNSFCPLVTKNGQDPGEVELIMDPVLQDKPLTWNTDILDKYNAVSNFITSLEQSYLQLDPPDGLLFNTNNNNVIYDAAYNSLFGVDAENFTVAGGSSISRSVQVGLTKTEGVAQTNFLDLSVAGGLAIGSDFGSEFAGVSVTLASFMFQAGITFEMNTEFSQEATQSYNTEVTSAYTITDDDEGDQVSVTVIRGPAQNHTPYFQLFGGRTSCPYEEGTIARDVPLLSLTDANGNVASNEQFNVPPDQVAVFPLQLGNGSPFFEDRDYEVFLDLGSNPGAAIVRINGIQIGSEPFNAIPVDTPVYTTLSIERGPVVYDYENIRIGMRPTCEEDDRANYIEVTVHFQEPCTEVSISDPPNNWVINKENQMLVVYLTDYDVHNGGFENLVLESRRIGSNIWYELANLSKDSLLNYFNEFAATYPDPTYPFVIDINGDPGVLDGDYELRATAKCGTSGESKSNIVAGHIDRTPIFVFGDPEPKDGIQTQNDEISITFNETADCPRFNIDSTAGFYVISTENNSLVPGNVSCANDKMIFTPGISMQSYEGKTIQASVFGLYDMYGNKMEDTSRWEFTVINCPAPQNIYTDNITKTEARLNWDFHPDTDHYKLRGGLKGSNPNKYVYFTISIPSQTFLNVSKLSKNTQYEWQIIRYCSSDESLASAWSLLDTFKTVACEVPQNTQTITIGNNNATYSWNPVAGAYGYISRGRSVSNLTGWQYDTIGNMTSYLASIPPSTTWVWQVQSYCDNFKAVVSDWSAENTLSTETCGTPQPVKTQNITATSADLSWTIVNNADSYTLKGRQLGNTQYVSININNGLQWFYRARNLSPNKYYEWQIITNCGGSKSNWTDLDTFKTLATSAKTVEESNFVRDERFDVKIYPNPTSERFSVLVENAGDEKVSINMFNLLGVNLYQYSNLAQHGILHHEIDISDQADGVYILQVTVGGNTTVFKVIRRK